MEFAKYHGLGNDFIMVFGPAGIPTPAQQRIAALCDRRLGIGGDGLVLLSPSDHDGFDMRIFNSDGSEAAMCGNAIRCAAAFLLDEGLHTGECVDISTPAGVKHVRILGSPSARLYEADMGEPRFLRPDIPMLGEGECQLEHIAAGGREFLASAVNTGVPHLVVFTDEPLPADDILHFGELLHSHPLFYERTNVDFACIGSGGIAVDTYERGCGRTLACGTGACAAAVCAARAGYTGRASDVIMRCGRLHIDWRQDGRMYMTGPAQRVFFGRVQPGF